MEIVVVGTHEFQWALWPFSILFARYWGPETVIYYGDRQAGDLPKNLEFRRVPCFREGVWPWEHHFGRGLMSVLEDLEGPTVAIFLPDHWLNAPVNLETVDALRGYMEAKGDVVRGGLADEPWLYRHARDVEAWRGTQVVAVPPSDVHCGLEGGVTFGPALWSRKLLRGILEPGWSLWTSEKVGTEKMVRLHPKVRSVGTRPGALTRTHGLYHGDRRRVCLDGLCGKDQEMVRSYLPGGLRE